MIKKLISVLLGAVILAEALYLVYPYTQRQQMKYFNCSANLVQHYNAEAYELSLNYMIRGNFGLVHITGRSDVDPEKIFNRKVSFRLQRYGDLYYMIAEKNIKLPGDNFNDEELSAYVPHFFITSQKDIYMRILKQSNNNFVFMVDSIPTYICNTSSKGN